jgi:hypothetical protein
VPAGAVVEGRGQALDNGYEAPPALRAACRVSYVTAKFNQVRRTDELPCTDIAARWAPPYPIDGLSLLSVATGY